MSILITVSFLIQERSGRVMELHSLLSVTSHFWCHQWVLCGRCHHLFSPTKEGAKPKKPSRAHGHVQALPRPKKPHELHTHIFYICTTYCEQHLLLAITWADLILWVEFGRASNLFSHKSDLLCKTILLL